MTASYQNQVGGVHIAGRVNSSACSGVNFCGPARSKSSCVNAVWTLSLAAFSRLSRCAELASYWHFRFGLTSSHFRSTCISRPLNGSSRLTGFGWSPSCQITCAGRFGLGIKCSLRRVRRLVQVRAGTGGTALNEVRV
jgi:hypothetical protein